MSAILEGVKAAALVLSTKERCELIDFLEDISIDEMNSIRREWQLESQRRLMELESRTVTGVPLENVFRHRQSKRDRLSSRK